MARDRSRPKPPGYVWHNSGGRCKMCDQRKRRARPGGEAVMEIDRVNALIERAADAMLDFEEEQPVASSDDEVAELWWNLATAALVGAGVIERHPRAGWRLCPPDGFVQEEPEDDYPAGSGPYGF